MTKKLLDRGISPETLSYFQVTPGQALGKQGWSYPVMDRNRKVIARRWKNKDSKDSPKYIWARGSKAGKLIYNAEALTRIKNREIWVVNGEPVVWQMHTGGFDAICWFGEGNIPDNLALALKQVGVKTVHYAPDHDRTGRKPETLARLRDMLAQEEIELKLYDFTVIWKDEHGKDCPEGHDLGDLINACRGDDGFIDGETLQVFLKAVKLCPLEVVPAPVQERLPEAEKESPKAGKSTPAQEKKLPEEFIYAIMQALEVKRFNRDGWSKNVKCPFKEHEHDKTQPGGQWNREMQCFRCHKCGQTWNAKETGEALGIKLENFLKKKKEGVVIKGRKPSHIEIGDRLIKQWNGNIRFFRERWNKFNGQIWEPLAPEQIRRRIWLYLKDCQNRYEKLMPRKADVNSISDYLQSILFLRDEMIDLGEGFIPLKNGLYNLTSGELQEYKRDLYLTSQLGFEYDPTATCPQWRQFLNEMLVKADKTPDEELQVLLQQAFGYSLTENVRREVSFWLHGEAGSGKSTVLEVLQALAGNSWAELDLSSLDTNRYQLADLPGKRIVTCSEVASGAYLQDHIFKKLVSGETMTVRQIREKPFTFRPQCKLWWAMNYPPGIRDRSEGVYRRLITIPFLNPLPAEKRDTTLKDRLLNEIPGIFNWALEGLARLQNGKFLVPDSALDLKAALREENDPENKFVVEWCMTGDYKIKSSQLYEAYRQWCKYNGLAAKSSVKMAREWIRLGFVKQKEPDGHFWQGITLNSVAAQSTGHEIHGYQQIPF